MDLETIKNLSFQGLMNSAKNPSVKELIEALKELHGSTLRPASLSDLARIYGVSRQNLTNWMKSTPERSKMFAFIERASRDLQWDDAKAFKKTIKGKK